MNHKKEQWVDDVFDAIKHKKEVKPRPELLLKIQEKINHFNTQELKTHWQVTIAASVLTLLLNISALLYDFNHNRHIVDEDSYAQIEEQPLINSFQLYD